MKTPVMIMSSREFLEELDLKKSAYPYTIGENSAEYNEIVIHLVKMLSEELILLSAASDKGVTVSEQEVQSAEDRFKTDYPEDSFDQMLLENAISYSFWKKRFRRNMIIDKLIDQELNQKIEITSQDIVEFYKQYRPADPLGTDDKALGEKKKESESELIARLRLQKTQDRYDEWIQQLELNYPVEINMEKLKTFLLDLEKNEGIKNEKEN